MMERPLGGLTALALGVVLSAGVLTPEAAWASIFVGFQSPNFNVAPGDTFTAYIVIQQADAQFNAFDASVRFDPAKLSFEPITPVSDQRGQVMTSSCGNTFHQFAVMTDSLKITLSLLCSNTFVTGPGTIYRVRFRASLTPGTTTLTLGPFTEFYRAGLFERPLNKQSMQVTIGNPTGVDPEPAHGKRLEFAPPAPNPRRGTSMVLFDFTLPGPDVVSMDVIDLQGRIVAHREGERLDGGRHKLSWSPPVQTSGGYFVRLRTLSNGSSARRWAVLW